MLKIPRRGWFARSEDRIGGAYDASMMGYLDTSLERAETDHKIIWFDQLKEVKVLRGGDRTQFIVRLKDYSSGLRRREKRFGWKPLL